MKLVKVIAKYLLFVFISLVIGLNIYSLNARVLLKEKLPMPFNKGVAIVMSGSMEPTLSVDDLVIVEKSENYKTGDVVIYEANNSLIIHRIVEIDEEGFVAKGDYNNAPDAKQNLNVIKGKMITSIPKVGYLVYLLKKPVVSIVLVIMMFALLELSYRKEDEESKKEIEKLKAEIERLKND